MNTTTTSQMAHQNPVHHQPPPLTESDEANHKINRSPSSSSTKTTDEVTRDHSSRRLPSEASDSDKKESVSSTEKQRQEQEQEQVEEHQEQEAGDGDDNGRERLKRHRREVAGRVWIPEMWGQEDLLKDWIDCSSFDSCLVPTGISSARDALVQEARRASSGAGLRLGNRCLILR